MTFDGLQLSWRAQNLCSNVRASFVQTKIHSPATVLFFASDKYRDSPAKVSASKSSSPSSSSIKNETTNTTTTTTTENDSAGDVNVWDSNAESVRGRWKNRTSSSSSSSSSVEGQSWNEAPNVENNWQWWLSGPDDDAYAYESKSYGGYDDDDEDEDDDDSFMSWFNLDDFDPQTVMSVLKWMVPAAAIFLPWLLGGPMFFMAIFVFSPWIQKLIGSLMPSIWKMLWHSLNSQARPKEKQSKSGKTSSFNDRRYNGFWRWMRENRPGKNDDDEWTKADELGQLSKLGGWDDYDEDFLMLQKISRGSSSIGITKRRKKKEVPLLFRLVLAIFPFLRSWGGFL